MNTYIQNKGVTKTVIHDNNNNSISKVNWDADYDGNVANISVDLLNNGKKQHFDMKLNNDDLAKLLTVPSVNQPLHKRLADDFRRPLEFKFNDNDDLYNNTFERNDFGSGQHFLIVPQYSRRRRLYKKYRKTPRYSKKQLTHISSPVDNLIVPLTINKKTSQTHKAHKVYKVKKHSSTRKLSKKKVSSILSNSFF
jgi:hypothetical protein